MPRSTSTTRRAGPARRLLALGAGLVVAGTVTMVAPTVVAGAAPLDASTLPGGEQEAVTATGATGLTISVAPGLDLDPAGEAVAVTVTGLSAGDAVRVAYGVPSPAVPTADGSVADEGDGADERDVDEDAAPAVVGTEVVVPAAAVTAEGRVTVDLVDVAAVVTAPDGTIHDLVAGGGAVWATTDLDAADGWDVGVPVSFTAPAPGRPDPAPAGDTDDPDASPAAADGASSVPTPRSVRAGSGSRTGTGPSGQTLTVTPADDLDPAGETITVTGAGYTAATGFTIATDGLYVGLCVDNGPGAQPSPCIGGVDMDGATGSSQWVTNNPYEGVPAVPIAADGSFTADISIQRADEFVDCLALTGGRRCVVVSRVDHRRSGDRRQDVKVPVCFAGETSCGTDPIEPPPVDPPTPPTPRPDPPAGLTPSGTRTGTGPNGQTLTASPVDNLDPAGTEVEVVGRGFTEAAGLDHASGGLYISFCVDNGPGAQPSPCIGGVDMEGETGSSQWVTNNPIGDAPAVPIAADGSFTAHITVSAQDEFVDCLALTGGKRCVIVARADHRATADRSQDVKVPVCFAGEAACATDPIDTTATATPTFTGFPLGTPTGGTTTGPTSYGSLATTGADSTRLVTVGLVLAGLGVALVLLSRRSSAAPHPSSPEPRS